MKNRRLIWKLLGSLLLVLFYDGGGGSGMGEGEKKEQEVEEVG